MIKADEIAYTRYCFVLEGETETLSIHAKDAECLRNELNEFAKSQEDGRLDSIYCLFAVPVMKSELADAFKVTPDQVMSTSKIMKDSEIIARQGGYKDAKEVSDGNS